MTNMCQPPRQATLVRGRFRPPARLKASWIQQHDDRTAALSVRLVKMNERLERLTDAYLDQVLEKDLFEARKAVLLKERREVEETIASLRAPEGSGPDRMQEFLELAESAYLLYQTAIPEEKRDLLTTLTSNRQVVGKNVEITLVEPFRSIAERHNSSNGAPCWDIPRAMFHVRRGAVLDVLVVQLDSPVTIFTSKLGNAIADRIRNSHGDPFPHFFVAPLKELFYLTLVNPFRSHLYPTSDRVRRFGVPLIKNQNRFLSHPCL